MVSISQITLLYFSHPISWQLINIEKTFWHFITSKFCMKNTNCFSFMQKWTFTWFWYTYCQYCFAQIMMWDAWKQVVQHILTLNSMSLTYINVHYKETQKLSNLNKQSSATEAKESGRWYTAKLICIYNNKNSLCNKGNHIFQTRLRA